MEIRTNCAFRGLIDYPFQNWREELGFCYCNAEMNYPRPYVNWKLVLTCWNRKTCNHGNGGQVKLGFLAVIMRWRNPDFSSSIWRQRQHRNENHHFFLSMAFPVIKCKSWFGWKSPQRQMVIDKVWRERR